MIVKNIKSNKIASEARLNSGYFLNEDAINSSILEQNINNCDALSDLADVWNPPIFKRQFSQKTDKSTQYCQSSDVPNSFEGNDVYINKNQADKVNALVKENQILITGFGTIGNTRIVNKISDGICYANNVCRVDVRDKGQYGYVYAVLTSKYGYSQLNKNASGSVVRYIEAPGIKKTLIPKFDENFRNRIHNLIIESTNLKVESNLILDSALKDLKSNVGLKELDPIDYEYFGNHSENRQTSTFIKSINDISNLSINAFNYSEKIEKLSSEVKQNKYLSLGDCLDKNQFFSTGSFRRLEIQSKKAIKLLNQSDIFNFRKVGKNLSRRYVKSDRLVEYGEVLIAGVGTLGEGETFCRTIFANEELANQLVAGEFIRMKTNKKTPSGYLFCWLSSDYGFRLIRSTQTGTKLCRPIQEFLKDIPVPILEKSIMDKIDSNVKKAHSMLYQALLKENQAIDLVEKEIEEWEK
tara:strand:+ start:9904 stop:11307 length:1404 start_codon:yes stop_codon:yes gene_type:complete